MRELDLIEDVQLQRGTGIAMAHPWSVHEGKNIKAWFKYLGIDGAVKKFWLQQDRCIAQWSKISKLRLWVESGGVVECPTQLCSGSGRGRVVGREEQLILPNEFQNPVIRSPHYC